jgi:hypothetical protein
MPFIPHTTMSARCSRPSACPSIEALFDEIRRNFARRRSLGRPRRSPRLEIARLMHRARDAGRSSAVVPRCRRVRAPYSLGGVGNRHARRDLQRLHPVPGRGEPGHAAGDLRIPDDDRLAHRHAGVECDPLRWWLGARRGCAHGGTRASQVEFAAHPRADYRAPALSQGGSGDGRQPGACLRHRALCARVGLPRARGAGEARRRGHHRTRDPATQFLRHARGCRCAHRLGACAGRARDRGRESHLARAAEATGRVGRKGGWTSSSAKASRSACRCPRAGRTSAS